MQQEVSQRVSPSAQASCVSLRGVKVESKRILSMLCRCDTCMSVACGSDDDEGGLRSPMLRIGCASTDWKFFESKPYGLVATLRHYGIVQGQPNEIIVS